MVQRPDRSSTIYVDPSSGDRFPAGVTRAIFAPVKLRSEQPKVQGDSMFLMQINAILAGDHT